MNIYTTVRSHTQMQMRGPVCTWMPAVQSPPATIMAQSHAGCPPGQSCQHAPTAGAWRFRKHTHTAAHIHLPPVRVVVGLTSACALLPALIHADLLPSYKPQITHIKYISHVHIHTEKQPCKQAAVASPRKDRTQQVHVFHRGLAS